MDLGFTFRLCISAGAYLDLGCGWMLFRDGRASGPLMEEASQVSSPKKAPGGCSPDWGKRERSHNFLQKHCLDLKADTKESAPAHKASPAQHCSALVWQPGHLCGCQQHHHCAWPTLEGESPPGLVQPLIAPSRHRQGWRLSHTPPAYSPLLGLTHTAPCATHTEHFWDHFRESQWMS